MTDTTSKSNHQRLRIGILGVATISRKNALALLDDDSGCVLTMVASRSEEKVKAFVESISTSKQPGIIGIGGSTAYNDLIQSKDIDAIYVPLPTTLHKEWVNKALEAGKHVVVEKPVALSSSDYQEMLQTAYKNNKFLMDGTMFQHHNRLLDIVQHVKDHTGQVDRIQANFSFMGDEQFKKNNIRTRKDGDPLGCIGDLGWYCVRFALVVYRELGYGQPQSARTVDYKLTPDGVPLDATCIVRFEKGRVLWFHCSFQTHFRQHVEICGMNHCVTVDDFVLPDDPPNKFTINSNRYDREMKVSEMLSVQQVLMWKNFAKISQNVEDLGWGEDTGNHQFNQEAPYFSSVSIMNQKILDALMESISRGGVEVDIC